MVLRALLVTAATAAIAVGCLSAAPALAQQSPQAGASSLDGDWVNVDPNARGIVEIVIAGRDVHPYGACHRKPCDWGWVRAKSVAPSADSSGIGGLVVKKGTGLVAADIRLSLQADGRLRAETSAPAYRAVDYLTRSRRPASAPAPAQQSPQAGASSLDGDWLNVDPSTRGIAEIVVAKGLFHLYGACHPNPCDWGDSFTFKRESVVSSADSAGVGKLVKKVNTGLSQVDITLLLQPDGRLRAETFTHYADGSGRADYSAVDYLSRGQRPASPPMNLNPQSGGTQEYHIEVTVLGSGGVTTRYNWRAATDLKEAKPEVSLGSVQAPLRISHPLSEKEIAKQEFSPHLLVIFPLGKPRPSDGDGDVVQTLSSALSKGWLVSASRSDGSFTPYCSSAATLESALAANGAAPLSPEDAVSAAQTATAGLEKFAGRRVLLIANGTNKFPYALPYAWLFEVQGALGRIYVVDGGITVKETFADLDTLTGYYYGFDMDSNGIPRQVRSYDRGLAHELKLSDAVKDVLSDDRNYYDLEFSIPGSLSGSILPVALTLHSGGDRPVVTATMYSLAPSAASGSSAVERVTVPQRPIVVWK
jgi:hypothetical protein